MPWYTAKYGDTWNSCSAFNPSKVHTHSSEHTHREHTQQRTHTPTHTPRTEHTQQRTNTHSSEHTHTHTHTHIRGWHGSEFSNLSRPTPTKNNLFLSQSHEKTGENPVPFHSRKNDSHSLPLPCCCLVFLPKSVSYSKHIVKITACPPY